MLECAFRSILNVTKDGKQTILPEDLVKNFRSFKNANLTVREKPYEKLFAFIESHYKEFNDIPDFDYTKEYFEHRDGDETVLTILDKIETQKPYLSGTYQAKLKEITDGQKLDEFKKVVTDCFDIASIGKITKKGKKQEKIIGLEAAINYFSKEVRPLLLNLTGVKTESQIISSEDLNEVKEEYKKVKKDPTDVLGILTGLSQVDKVVRGLKNTELMLCAASVGQGKTTFALNMIYQAVEAGWNCCFITLEMPFKVLRRMVYILHSCNPKFLKTQYKDLVGSIDFDKVTFGNLTNLEEDFFHYVMDDLDNCANDGTYGRLHLWQPDTSITTVTDVELKLREVQSEFSGYDKNLEFVVIDYISLLGVDKDNKQKDNNENLNFIIKQLKQLCIKFNNSQGLRMLSPFQVNRAGLAEADKNGGVYNTSALSNAHEAERSADVVVSLYMDKILRTENQVKVCCLKHRMGEFFSPFNAAINFKCRYLCDYSGGELGEDVQVYKGAIEEVGNFL